MSFEHIAFNIWKENITCKSSMASFLSWSVRSRYSIFSTDLTVQSLVITFNHKLRSHFHLRSIYVRFYSKWKQTFDMKNVISSKMLVNFTLLSVKLIPSNKNISANTWIKFIDLNIFPILPHFSAMLTNRINNWKAYRGILVKSYYRRITAITNHH